MKHSPLSVFGFLACCFVWFNDNTVYPSEFYGHGSNRGLAVLSCSAVSWLDGFSLMIRSVGSRLSCRGGESFRNVSQVQKGKAARSGNNVSLRLLPKCLQPWRPCKAARTCTQLCLWGGIIWRPVPINVWGSSARSQAVLPRNSAVADAARANGKLNHSG